MIKTVSCITYGYSTMRESWVFEGGSNEKRIPIMFAFYLLETENKKILVDAGCDTMSENFPMTDFIGPVAALQKQGTQPEEITDILLTHAHHDHAHGICHFPNATVHVEERELEKAGKYFSESTKVHVFRDEYSMDGITVRRIGGHSAGSCVAEFTLDGKNCVICGDECYSMYNIVHKIPTAKSVCPEASQAFIDKYANGDYVCLLCHDK